MSLVKCKNCGALVNEERKLCNNCKQPLVAAPIEKEAKENQNNLRNGTINNIKKMLDWSKYIKYFMWALGLLFFILILLDFKNVLIYSILGITYILLGSILSLFIENKAYILYNLYKINKEEK